jgi:hypothetical protein
MRKYIRINDQYIRTEYIIGFRAERWYTTDSMATIYINMLDRKDIEINLYTLQWMPENEAREYLDPKIQQIFQFLDSCIGYANNVNYEIEV